MSEELGSIESAKRHQDTNLILGVLLKMQECASLDECQEVAANLYQCFGEYALDAPVEAPCHDELVKWVGNVEEQK